MTPLFFFFLGPDIFGYYSFYDQVSKYIFVLDLLNMCLLYTIRVNISVHNV